MDTENKSPSGPRVFYLCARRAGPIEEWGRHVENAQALGCDWLWLGDAAWRAAASHRFAVLEPGSLAQDESGQTAARKFLADVHGAGLKVVTDFIPAFVARASGLVREHPGWFVPGPAGTPAVPAGVGSHSLAETLAECDFSGSARIDLVGFWSRAATRLLGLGFDALVCRAAHRVPVPAWIAILRAARREATRTAFWADTLGASIELAEALAPVHFDAFLSSACWWDFHSDWFPEQEARLRRLAPTIAFPEEPGGARIAAGEENPAQARALATWRFRFAAAVAWGVVLPMGYQFGWRLRLGETGSEEPARFDLTEEIGTLNRLRASTPALNDPGHLRRLTAAQAAATMLAAVPRSTDTPAVLVAVNPDAGHYAEFAVGPLFSALDSTVAAARELTPGRSPERLSPGRQLALEPATARWFELVPPPMQGAVAARPAPQPKFSEHGLEPIGVENIWPRVEGGGFPCKRTLGEMFEMWADLVTEGHDRIAAVLRYRHESESQWRESPMVLVDNDRWHGRFFPDGLGAWRVQLAAWRDRYGSWRLDCLKRRDAGLALGEELPEGEAFLREAVAEAPSGLGARLAELAKLVSESDDPDAKANLLLAETSAELVGRALPRLGFSTCAEQDLLVERGRACSGAWYECFPRSLGQAGRHGTFDDLIAHLPYIASLGFDVVYLPPIHPIGHTHRKGRNNALEATAEDPGSPWAIGSEAGGHRAVHSGLGTLADFRRLLKAAREQDLQVALDFAVQCSPDHPWIREHPEWFRWRSDGSIRYAENPPKKYEDIVNVDFYGAREGALWRELAEILLFWCGQGVRIFRVDNPHTKPLPFWEWLLTEVRARYPDVVFLSEAFTRPKLMHRLAKLGFSQSYTYFTWRNTKAELMEYLTQLGADPVPQYFRPNFWVNTPDINPYYLQTSGRAGFVIRATLAATLAPSWGMYSGYELCECEPQRNPDGSAREEYLNSEKYELKHRDFDAPGNIRAEIAVLNRIRRDNPALTGLGNHSYHAAYNDEMLFYSRHRPDNVLWIVVSLDPHAAQEADVELPLEMLAAGEGDTIAVEELLAGERWEWRGRRQRLRLEPARPALILRISKVAIT